MGKIIVCCLTLVVEGFDKLHLILYRAGVILLNINMKWMITSQISSDLVKMWEKGGMQLSADGSLTPDATDWILGEQNKCADKMLYIYLYDVLSRIWSSPKLSGLTILTFFLFQFWKDEIASKATHFGWVVISLSIWSDLLTLRLDLKVWLLDGGDIVQSEGKVLSQGEMAWQCHDGPQIWILMLAFSLPFTTPTS